METIASRDGTRIGFDRLGDGPPVVLVCGGSTDRMSNAGLAAALAPDFTVLNYDRRGRGDSGDTLPYAPEREFEDIAAVLEAAGGSAHLYGSSSGAGLALEATATGLPVRRLALWEPPYFLDPAQAPPSDQIEQYNRMLAEGRRDDAVEYFMTKVVRLPAEFAAYARTQPFWASTVAIAHTLPYDATIMGDYSIPVASAAKVLVPTVVITGEASFAFMHETAEALAKALPDGRTASLPGQEHNVAPDALAPVLKAFFVE